nr:hypothetical protein [Tanacetum cinerariifolium]
MSSITAQQTKLDLELVPNENRLDIEKCNGRIPRGLTPREPTFQVVQDTIALTPCYPTFLITVDVPEVYMHQFWNYVVYKKQEKMYYPQFTKAIIHHFLIQDKTLSWRNKIRMHTYKHDYLINSLRCVSTKESTQIYGAILPECLTSPAMKESKAYKTFLGYPTGSVPPNIARKFKKASLSTKDSNLVPVDKEPITKGKRVKRYVKKSLTKPAIGIVIRKPPVETKSKRKEKVDVARGKGIELLYEIALAEKAQMKESQVKELVINQGWVLDVTKDDSTESESESWGNDEDDNNDENDSKDEGNNKENKIDDDKTPFDSEKGSDSEQDSDRSESDSESDRQEDEEEVKDNDEEEDEMNEPTQTDEEVVQDKEADEIEVPDASFSHSSDLASKFLNFLDIHPNDAKIVSRLDVHVYHEVPRTHKSTFLTVPISVIPESSPVCTTIPQSSQTFTSPLLLTTPTTPPTIETTNTPSTIANFASVFRLKKRVTVLEKDVVELKKDPLHTQVTALVDDHLDTRMGATREEFMNFLSDRKDKDKDEGPSAGSDRGFMKRKTSKDTEPTTSPKNKDSTSGSSKGTKSQPKLSRKTVQSEVPEFKVVDTDLPQDQVRNLGKTPQKGPTQNWLMALAASSSTDKSLKSFDELMSTPIDFSANIRMVPAKEKMEFLRKEKSSLHNQGNQQATEGKKDDVELGKICWWETLRF